MTLRAMRAEKAGFVPPVVEIAMFGPGQRNRRAVASMTVLLVVPMTIALPSCGCS
jgi:hypothetical protein